MRWRCQRGCGSGGSKGYATAAAAESYATVLDREDNADLGRRAPLVGMFPLRVWHALRRRFEAR